MITPVSQPPAFPEFDSHPLIRGGHAQTLCAVYLPGRLPPYRAIRRPVLLDDGDTVVLHDDHPPGWLPGDPAVLLIHGLAGCHLSGYMVRIAAKLNALGLRSFRMDLRGCGAGQGLARLPYHAGRSGDALAALEKVAALCPESPLFLAGFSLGGNISLKLLGEEADSLPDNLIRAVAVNPAIDLGLCTERLRGPIMGRYDRHFVKQLLKQLRAGHVKETLTLFETAALPRRMLDFDDVYTARVSGFGSAQNYYERCSAVQFLPGIRVPTLILTAADDPLVPVEIFRSLHPSPYLHLAIARGGGHLGFIGRNGVDSDRRWMDWRVIDWITAGLSSADRARIDGARPDDPDPDRGPAGGWASIRRARRVPERRAG